MEIYNKAKELAGVIANSQELKNMQKTEGAMMGNSEAKKLIEEYQKYQMETMQEGGFEDLSEEKQKEIEVLEEKMSQNEYIVDYMEAQEKLEQTLRSVNLIISSALNGDESECSSSGCSSCTSC